LASPRANISRAREWIGGVGRTNDPLLCSYLYEAGVLMTRVRGSCRLKSWAKRLAKRIGWKRLDRRCPQDCRDPACDLARWNQFRVKGLRPIAVKGWRERGEVRRALDGSPRSLPPG
jgi:hypothetical protein